jgi:hypothetical protein
LDKQSAALAKKEYFGDEYYKGNLNRNSLSPEQLKQVEAEYDNVLNKTNDLG